MDQSWSTVHATPSFIWTIRRRSQLEKNHDQVLSAKYLVRSLALVACVARHSERASVQGALGVDGPLYLREQRAA